VPGWENYAYSASKAALHMLTQHLAYRLARERITVNAIAPGYFETRMSAFLFDDSDVRTDVERTVPLGRLGRPDDMAGVGALPRLARGRVSHRLGGDRRWRPDPRPVRGPPGKSERPNDEMFQSSDQVR